MLATGIAVVGAGPWGLTLASAFAGLPQIDVRWICELDEERRARAGAAQPDARLTADLEDALRDPKVAAVVVAVDPARHHAVAMRALGGDKHLFVEKPLALSVADAREIQATAAARRRVLTVGHLLLHHPAIRHARPIVANGLLGEPLTFSSRRTTPGAPRQPGSAWWALAPHDISLALHLFDALPATVTATCGDRGDAGEDHAVTAVLHFANGRSAQIQIARFSSRKRRDMTIGGSKATLTFDELADAAAALRLWTPQQGTAALAVDGADALRAQCAAFASCVARDDDRGVDGAHAVDVVAVLEAGEHSMRRNGAPQPVVREPAPAAACRDTRSFEAA
jgi:predicted dehydrogenase